MAVHGLVFQNGKLASLDATVTGGFGIGGGEFRADALHMADVTAGDDLTLDGRATLTVKSGESTSALSATFGTADAPGLVIEAGTFKKLDVTADGTIQVGGTTVTTKALRVVRDATADTLTATGTASVAAGETAVEVRLGTAATDTAPATRGLVFADGKLASFDAAVTGGIAVGGASFTADALHMGYVAAAAELTVDGRATLAFKAGGTAASLSAKFGTPDAPGLVIAHGQVRRLDVTADGALVVGGMTLTAKGVTLNRAANGDLAAKEAVEFTTNGTTIGVALGHGNAPGLVIERGELKTLDAAVTTDFAFSGVRFAAKSLRFAYVHANGQSSFEVTGSAAASFTAAGKTSTLGVGFGTPAAPGLRIVNGSFDQMNRSVAGEASVGGAFVTRLGRIG